MSEECRRKKYNSYYEDNGDDINNNELNDYNYVPQKFMTGDSVTSLHNRNMNVDNDVYGKDHDIITNLNDDDDYKQLGYTMKHQSKKYRNIILIVLMLIIVPMLVLLFLRLKNEFKK